METHVIDHLGHLGDGVIAAPDGPLYAPFTLPGETVVGRRDGDRLTDLRIETPSPQRRAPPCRHFGVCGGCAVQHADDALVAAWKTDMVAAALSSRGLSAPIRPIVTAPAGARRRVTFAGRRTRKTALIGFHGRADATLIPIAECPVTAPAIMAALPTLAEVTGLVASRSGEVRLTVTLSENGLDVAVEGQRPMDRALFDALSTIAAQGDLARLTYGDEAVATRRQPRQVFGGVPVTPPSGGFLQAAAESEAALVAAVRETVGEAGRVTDLFAGSGAFTLPLAARAAVHAVEGDAAAIGALVAGWRAGRGLADGLRGVTTETRDLFRRPLLADELRKTDAVVIDPPRAGAAAQTAQIAASAVPTVAAVSCNPATFARDARTLVDAGFRLTWVQPVDQFRWSPHVELAAAFHRG